MLAEARRLTAGQIAADGGAWARSAAFLARQALEVGARRALVRKYSVSKGASFKAQMLSLRAVADNELARDAYYTWTALSGATHHHEYTLPPTAWELNRWMAVVERVLELSPAGDCA